MTTEILSLDELVASQGSPDVTHNTALRQIEGRMVRALDKDLTVAPVSPTAGDVYIVASGATGTWSGKDKKIAHYWGGSWKYYTAIEGNSLWLCDENKRYTFDGTNWGIEPAFMSDGDKGDITVSSSGTVLTVDNDVITYAKIQNVSATDKLLGRSTAGAGDIEEITCTAFARSILDDADAATVRTTIGAGTGSGDVTGPGSSTNNHVVFFSGTSGKVIADSGLTLSGTNTGDQTSVSGNAGTATALATARTIDGQSFDGTANITVIAPGTHAATSKATPVDDDEIPIVDSEASNALKKLTWANLKATLKTYFDTLYAPLTQPVSINMFYPGVPTASVLVSSFAAPTNISTITFASAIAGSSGKALTAATAQTDFDVRKNATTSANGTSVGTVRFAASGTVPTFIAASGFTLTGGSDWLTVWGPASPDATLANITISLYATR